MTPDDIARKKNYIAREIMHRSKMQDIFMCTIAFVDGINIHASICFVLSLIAVFVFWILCDLMVGDCVKWQRKIVAAHTEFDGDKNDAEAKYQHDLACYNASVQIDKKHSKRYDIYYVLISISIYVAAILCLIGAFYAR